MGFGVMIARVAIAIGVIAMIGGVVWWFAYYSQWQGAFALLDVKIGCLVTKAAECQAFREFIGASSIPSYQPGVFLGGLIMVVSGIVMLKRRA